MTPSTAKSIISALRYAHSSIFSPVGMLVALILLGIVPLSWLTAMTGAVVTLVEGATRGVINSIEKAVGELEDEAG